MRINRTSVSIVSHPGPDPSISMEDIKVGRMVSRRYRNRRIGEFLKELEFTEGRGTGVPKIRRVLKNNGSLEPSFFTDSERASFWIEIKIHPEFLEEQVLAELPQVTPQVTRQVVDFCQVPRKASEIKELLRLKDSKSFRNNYLRPFIEEGLITLTVRDKPQSRFQQYIMTDKGKRWLQKRYMDDEK